MNKYLSELENDFLNFLKMSGFKLLDYTCQGEIWIKGSITITVSIGIDGKVVIEGEVGNVLSEYNIYDALTNSCVADDIIGNAKQYIANVVSMLCTPSSEKEKDDLIVDLCNKVINTDPEVDFHESCPAGIAYCVFCDAKTRLPIFEKVQHKEHCAVLLAKEILKGYPSP